MASSGVSPEDLAKSLLVQAALADKGATGDAIAIALNQLAKEGKADLKGLVEKVSKELSRDGGISQEDIAKTIAIAKAIEVG